jgi:hypothetical protein
MPAEKALVERSDEQLWSVMGDRSRLEGPAGYEMALGEYMRRTNERRAADSQRLAKIVAVATVTKAVAASLVILLK